MVRKESAAGVAAVEASVDVGEVELEVGLGVMAGAFGDTAGARMPGLARLLERNFQPFDSVPFH